MAMCKEVSRILGRKAWCWCDEMWPAIRTSISFFFSLLHLVSKWLGLNWINLGLIRVSYGSVKARLVLKRASFVMLFYSLV